MSRCHDVLCHYDHYCHGHGIVHFIILKQISDFLSPYPTASFVFNLYSRQPAAPPYLYRQNFIPYQQSDFGDGGAFPEVHVVQYPLDMGRPGVKSTAVVSVDVDEKGEVRYDAIVRLGGNEKKIIQTSLDDMKEKKGTTIYFFVFVFLFVTACHAFFHFYVVGDTDKTSLPTAEEEAESTLKTQMALQVLLQGKIAKAARGTQGNMQGGNKQSKEPEYIRYTPNPDAPG